MNRAYITDYLNIAKQMLSADKEGNQTYADTLRDQMDILWYKMSPEEVELCCSRLAVILRAP